MSNRQRRVDVRARDVREIVSAVFAAEDAGEPDIGVALVNDEVIAGLNEHWLGHEGPTDSIAFSYEDDPGPDGLRGEVVVSAETAVREADERGIDPRHELLLYVAHGTLHLLGWDDDTAGKRRRMNTRARTILKRAGVESRP